MVNNSSWKRIQQGSANKLTLILRPDGPRAARKTGVDRPSRLQAEAQADLEITRNTLFFTSGFTPSRTRLDLGAISDLPDPKN